MITFNHAGVRYECEDGSVGSAGGGAATAAGAIRMIRERNLTGLRVLDLCCGVGVIGLTMLQDLGDAVIEQLMLADINVFNLRSVERTLRANAHLRADIVIRLSNGLENLVDDQFDLIVSNPPHCFADKQMRDDLPLGVMLATYDLGWQLHSAFYSACHNHLTRRGEVWFLENNAAFGEAAFRHMIVANRQLEYVGRFDEPTEPAYFWMLTRLRKNN